ncbi:MAG: D-alanyl-D-alanine carboxypeptidase [Clostridia bacterium]|nr:D-alanyl-D-alanine carboxypeptidase [Clostridia bacterium]
MENKKFLFVCIFTLLVLMIANCLNFSFSTKPFSAEEESPAKAMVLIEKNSLRVLKEKNKDERLAMASTTKIMTALLTCENTSNFDEIVLVNDAAIGIEGTSMYLKKGEKFTVKELLLGLMLPSGNDAAMALAYHIGGSEEKFVEMMNEKAKELNLKNTHFANPHGLDADGHYTSAYDLAVITAQAMQNEMFREIVFTKNATAHGSDQSQPRYFHNKNRCFKFLDGCTGVKTGFTDNAGRCFVCSAKRDGMELIAVVLNCSPMFEECARVIEDGFKKYKLYSLVDEYFVGGEIKVNFGEKDSVKTITKSKFCYPLTEDEYLKINIVRNQPESLEAEVEKDKPIGVLEIYLGDKLLSKQDIYTLENIKSVKYLDKIWEVVDNWNV